MTKNKDEMLSVMGSWDQSFADELKRYVREGRKNGSKSLIDSFWGN